MTDLIDALADVVASDRLATGAAIAEDDTHDECLTVEAVTPLAVVRPESTAEVSEILRLAQEHRVPVTARGAGTGLPRRMVSVWAAGSLRAARRMVRGSGM